MSAEQKQTTKAPDKQGALVGLKILDLSRVLAGPRLSQGRGSHASASVAGVNKCDAHGRGGICTGRKDERKHQCADCAKQKDEHGCGQILEVGRSRPQVEIRCEHITTRPHPVRWARRTRIIKPCVFHFAARCTLTVHEMALLWCIFRK